MFPLNRFLIFALMLAFASTSCRSFRYGGCGYGNRGFARFPAAPRVFAVRSNVISAAGGQVAPTRTTVSSPSSTTSVSTTPAMEAETTSMTTATESTSEVELTTFLMATNSSS